MIKYINITWKEKVLKKVSLTINYATHIKKKKKTKNAATYKL